MHWSIRYALAVAVALIVFGASLAVAGSKTAAEAPEDSPALFGTEPSHVGDRGLYKTALVVVHGERGEYHDMAARYAFERLPDRIMLTGDGRHVPVASFVGEWRSEPFPFDLRAALGLPAVPLFDVPDCYGDVDGGLAYSDPDRFARQMEACGEEMDAAGEEFDAAMEAWGEELDAAVTRKVESWFTALDAPTHQAQGAGWRVSHHEGNETVATTAKDPGALQSAAGVGLGAVGPDRTAFQTDGLHHTLPIAVPGPCGWRSSLQDGPQDMFRPINVHGACPPDMGLGFAEVTSVDGPIEMRVSGRDTVDGQRTIVFSEPDDPDRLRLWHAPDNPYPLRILTRIEAVPAPVLEEVPEYDPPRFYILHELVEFERGDATDPLDAPDAPTLDATSTSWGPERGGFDHPWPLDAAWQESVEATSDCREWLQWRQEHPDATVVQATSDHRERDDGQTDPTTDVTWHVVAQGGGDAVRVSMTQHTQTTADEPILVRVPQVACSSLEARPAPTGPADTQLPRIDQAAAWMQAFTGTAPTTYGFDRDAAHLSLWSGPDAPGAAEQEDRLTIDPVGGLVEHRTGSDTYPEPRFSDPAWSPRAGNAWGYGVASTGPWHMPEPATAASLAAGAAAAGLAVLLLPVAKSVLAATPFFSRIRKEALLDHPVRGHLADLVQEEPGIHFQEIVRRVAKGRGTTEHHLRKLVDADLLVEQQSKGFTCYFPKGRIDRRIMAAAPLMKSSGARRVMQAIAAEPGTAAQGIAQRLGMAPSTVNHHVKKLRAAGLVEAQRDGRFVVLHASDIGRQAADRFAAAS